MTVPEALEEVGLGALADAGRLKVLLRSTVHSIEQRAVHLDHDGRRLTLPNEAVIVCAGGELPTPLLRQVGIRFETKFGTR